VEIINTILKDIDLYEGNIKTLTEPEARTLRRASTLDFARNRIFEARQDGLSSLGYKTSFQFEAPTGSRNRHRKIIFSSIIIFLFFPSFSVSLNSFI